jgi:hypothetical protein
MFDNYQNVSLFLQLAHTKELLTSKLFFHFKNYETNFVIFGSKIFLEVRLILKSSKKKNNIS